MNRELGLEGGLLKIADTPVWIWGESLLPGGKELAHLFSSSCTVSGSGWPRVSGRRAVKMLATTGTVP